MWLSEILVTGHSGQLIGMVRNGDWQNSIIYIYVGNWNSIGHTIKSRRPK